MLSLSYHNFVLKITAFSQRGVLFVFLIKVFMESADNNKGETEGLKKISKIKKFIDFLKYYLYINPSSLQDVVSCWPRVACALGFFF